MNASMFHARLKHSLWLGLIWLGMTPSNTISAGINWIVAAASFGFVIVQLDVTIVNVALPTMAKSLGASVAELQWVVDAYTLSFAVLLMSAGILGDLFGTRRAYLAGFAVFAVASLACGLAPDVGWLVAARVAQGMGAALVVPNSLALLNHATGHDQRRRAHAVGLWTAAGGIAIGAGPVIGGLLIASLGWRSIFLVNLPLCALGALLTRAFAPESPRQDSHRRMDLPGQGLAILALFGLIGGVIEAQPLGLRHPLVASAGLLFVAAAGAFIWVERRAKQPMLPLRFFADPGFNAAIGFGVAVNLAYYGVLFVLALYLQDTHGWTALQAGLALLPLTATFILSNLLSGQMIVRFGARPPMVMGGLIGAAGYLLLLRAGTQTPFLAMLPAFLLIPCGMGLGVPAMTTSILASVDKTFSGTASAVLNAARQAAAAMGVAVFGTLASGGRILSGLHESALTSAVLLATGAGLAWMFIAHARRPRTARI
jgi:DHA2 family methylenomycin A resistance protein-like MFS transporter